MEIFVSTPMEIFIFAGNKKPAQWRAMDSDQGRAKKRSPALGRAYKRMYKSASQGENIL